MAKAKNRSTPPARGGRLRIGNDWNAITIIALSQSNPLKAVAEFVENSIDAHARHVTITRGRERGEHYLRIADDGDGVPRDTEGAPDFKYVATHICDSIKRRMKTEGAQGLQGEFGIGLLSFWTVGDELTMGSAGTDGRLYQMRMRRGDPGYTVAGHKRALVPARGTELDIRPLLPGIRQFSGEKIQWYLASELRDRIRQSGVRIKVVDRQARKEYAVEPRQFSGRLLHQLPAPAAAPGEIYFELYLAEPGPDNQAGLYRRATPLLSPGPPPRGGGGGVPAGGGAGGGGARQDHRRTKTRRGGARQPRDAAITSAGVPRGAARVTRRGGRLVRDPPPGRGARRALARRRRRRGGR